MPADPNYVHFLRRKAEKALIEAPEKPALVPGADLQKLVHELSVHQIELEMQNEELRRSQEDLELSRSEYADLYDFAPVGYLTFDKTGLVTRANLTACGLLGIERSLLVKKSFAPFIHPESQDLFYMHRQKVLQTTATQTCDLVVKRKDGTFFSAQLESLCVQSAEAVAIRSILTDITERKAAEEDLRTSRLQLAEAADLARIAYWEYGEAADEIVFNDAFYTLYGTSAEREGGYRMSREKYVSEFVHADDRDKLRRQAHDNRARPRAGLLEHYEHRGVRRDGEVMQILVRTRVVADSKGRVIKIIGVNQDISARREMEDALRESETKLRAILDYSRDAISLSKDGILAFVNPACVSLFGYEGSDELIGMSVLDLVAPESRGAVVETMKKRAGGEPVPSFSEGTALRKDGTTFLVEARVSSYVLRGEWFALSIMRDVTDRRRAENEVRMLKHSIDVYHDGAYWINADRKFIYVNEAACKALGYKREELIGKTIFDIAPTLTPERTKDVWEELRTSGSYLTESVARRKDGSEFPVELAVTYIRFGGHEYACGFARDISEKKRLEEQLRRAQKMEALGTLTGGIAHDFNNILAAMIGFTEMAKARAVKGSREEQHLERVTAAGLRGRELVKQMLTFSRKTEHEKEPLQLSSLVKEATKLLRASIPSTIGIRVKAGCTSDFVLADPGQIQQVIMNLCTNAAQAMREKGGTLTIELKDGDMPPTDETGPGPYLRLVVRDTGAGIPADVVDKIFDPFFTTKAQGEGTGLGLSVVHGIVKQHDGHITVESTPGEGSAFTVHLPKTAERPKVKTVGEEPIPKGHERVLFIDDEEGIAAISQEILTGLGYKVKSKTSSRVALAMLRLDPSQFDLVITDQTMPDITGIELAKEVLALRPDMPVILCTGFSHIVNEGSARAAGIKAFVMKPLTRREIAKTIRKVLDG